MMKINPEWTRYNNTFNEGHSDSFNPHPKYIPIAAPVTPAVATTGKVYRDSRGMPIDPVARIAECEARLLVVTDVFARRSIEKSLSDYRKMLEG